MIVLNFLHKVLVPIDAPKIVHPNHFGALLNTEVLARKTTDPCTLMTEVEFAPDSRCPVLCLFQNMHCGATGHKEGCDGFVWSSLLWMQTATSSSKKTRIGTPIATHLPQLWLINWLIALAVTHWVSHTHAVQWWHALARLVEQISLQPSKKKNNVCDGIR